MALDPDQVRVDLLRIKRKLYLSYPEGSKERQSFLIASKLSELAYLQGLITPATTDEIFAEYGRQMKIELLNIGMCLGFGLCLTMMLLGFHQLHPGSILLSLYQFPFIIGLGWALFHVFHMVEHWQKFQPFKEECDILQERINKLISEIKEITK
jgi:hypothetical protein